MVDIDLINLFSMFVIKPMIIFICIVFFIPKHEGNPPSMRHGVLVTSGLFAIVAILLSPLISSVTLSLVPDSLSFMLDFVPDGLSRFVLLTLFSLYVFGLFTSINLRIYDLYMVFKKIDTAQLYHERLEHYVYDELYRLKQSLGLKKDIRILLGNGTFSPFTVGFFKPVIILPKNYTDWAQGRVGRVLFHECGHIKRHDFFVKNVCYFFACFFWYMPFIWAWLRNIEEASEIACDDLLMSFDLNRADYATDLIELSGRTVFNDACVNVSNNFLSYRVNSILSPSRNRKDGAFVDKFFIFLLLCGGILLINITEFEPINSIESTSSYSYTPVNVAKSFQGEIKDEKFFDPSQSTLSLIHSDNYELFASGDSMSLPNRKSFHRLEEVMVTYNVLVSKEIEKKQVEVLRPIVEVYGYLAIRNDGPKYPRKARYQGLEGRVVARFDIDAEGDVENINIIHAKPEGVFESSVISALENSIFEPAKINNEFVRLKDVSETFVFRLADATDNKLK